MVQKNDLEEVKNVAQNFEKSYKLNLIELEKTK